MEVDLNESVHKIMNQVAKQTPFTYFEIFHIQANEPIPL